MRHTTSLRERPLVILLARRIASLGPPTVTQTLTLHLHRHDPYTIAGTPALVVTTIRTVLQPVMIVAWRPPITSTQKKPASITTDRLPPTLSIPFPWSSLRGTVIAQATAHRRHLMLEAPGIRLSEPSHRR